MQVLRKTSLMVAVAVLGGMWNIGAAQYYPAPQYPQYVQYPDALPPVAPAVPGPAVLLSADQLDALLAPVALYPDPLLAELFPAATYPEDLMAAQAWLAATPNPTEDAIEAMPWDPSVQALMHYPTVLQYLTQNMDWTQTLGAAFLNQQQDVMDSVQRLRALAQAEQNLQTTAQQQIVIDEGAIRIEPVNPDLIYVPVYDPGLVYLQQCPIDFGLGLPIGFWFDNDFDWHDHGLMVGGGWYEGWHHPKDWDDHPPAWTQHRPARPSAAPHAWSHAPGKPAPRVSNSAVTRLGLDHPKAVGPTRSGAPARTATPVHVGSRTTPPVSSNNAFDPVQSRSEVGQAKVRAQAVQTPPARSSSSFEVHTPPAPRVETPAPREPAPAPRAETPAPRESAPPPREVAMPRPAEPARSVAPARTVAPSPAAPARQPPTFNAPQMSAPAFPSGGTGQDTRAQSQRGNSSLKR